MSKVRRALSADPETFRACASRLSVTVSSAAAAVGPDGHPLVRALDRFAAVHVESLYAVAGAVGALGGDIGRALDTERETQLAIAAAFSARAGLDEAS